jgi:hypothetical protein
VHGSRRNAEGELLENRRALRVGPLSHLVVSCIWSSQQHQFKMERVDNLFWLGLSYCSNTAMCLGTFFSLPAIDNPNSTPTTSISARVGGDVLSQAVNMLVFHLIPSAITFAYLQYSWRRWDHEATLGNLRPRYRLPTLLLRLHNEPRRFIHREPRERRALLGSTGSSSLQCFLV